MRSGVLGIRIILVLLATLAFARGLEHVGTFERSIAVDEVLLDLLTTVFLSDVGLQAHLAVALMHAVIA